MSASRSRIAALLASFAAAALAGDTVDGWGSVVSKAQLDALTFSSALDPNLRGGLNAKSAEGLATGVWLTGTAFAQGKPIHAYLVVKNARKEPAGVDMQIEPCRHPLRTVGSCNLHLTQTAGEQRWEQAPLEHHWIRSWAPLLTIPAEGYYCVRFSLNRLDKSGALPPGKYEFFWDYARLRSNTVRFTVGEPEKDADLTQGEFKRVRDIALLRLHPQGYECVKHDDRYAFAAKGASAEWKFSHDLAAFSTGVCGKHYVDPCDLPQQDEFLRVTAEWPRPEGKMPLPVQEVTELKLTLHPKPNEVKPVLDWARMCVLLQVEALDAAGDARAAVPLEQLSMQMTDLSIRFDRPWTLAVPLPAGWHKGIGFAGRARIAALIASDDIAMPRGKRMRMVEAEVMVRPGHALWKGVVRTPYLTVSIPAP